MNYEGGSREFKVKKSSRHHLNQVIRANTSSNVTLLHFMHLLVACAEKEDSTALLASSCTTPFPQ
jgi:hypothetical protein